MTTPVYPVLRVKDLAVGERPQERLERLGPAALSDTELLALLLRSGSRRLNVLAVAQQLITSSGSLARLVTWTKEDFTRQHGIGSVKALQLVAVMEVARRVLAPASSSDPIIESPPAVVALLQAPCTGLDIEKFWVLCLNRKNRLLKLVELSSGTATHSLAHPREVYREAVRHGATALICAHNHPSGDPAPSSADLKVTRQLREAAQAMDIHLHDHIIIGRTAADPLGRGYYSFRECGLL